MYRCTTNSLHYLWQTRLQFEKAPAKMIWKEKRCFAVGTYLLIMQVCKLAYNRSTMYIYGIISYTVISAYMSLLLNVSAVSLGLTFFLTLYNIYNVYNI